MTCILALDSALAMCSVALVRDTLTLASRSHPGDRGQAARMPGMVTDVLAEAGVMPAQLDLIAVTVGPGSFTGLRAALALAHGIGLGLGIPVIGVTVPEALAASVADTDGRAIWVAIDSRRGRVFLDRLGTLGSWSLDDLPIPDGPVAVCGDASITVTARLAARGADVRLTGTRLPLPEAIAAVALRRHAGQLPALAAQPLYVDPPEARLPAGGLRPMPVP
jgi:tRNA threonylcarbamoyl adenosine modification protein YeaZ